ELSARNAGTTLVLAIDYGGRDELARATREIAQAVASGKLAVDQIGEATIADLLDTRGLPDPDLLIRTGGEMRISNFLLWQISYAELWVTERPWPEFSRQDFLTAIGDFASRNRRYGGIADSDRDASLEAGLV
ncbi:MAG: polyprenyl diphosphate synthase, partial [Planctomycetaceae bacterium]